jgi:hypothetical protein
MNADYFRGIFAGAAISGVRFSRVALRGMVDARVFGFVYHGFHGFFGLRGWAGRRSERAASGAQRLNGFFIRVIRVIRSNPRSKFCGAQFRRAMPYANSGDGRNMHGLARTSGVSIRPHYFLTRI